MRIEGGVIEMVLHWQGGDHTALKLKMNAAGKHRWTVPEDTLSLVRELARLMPDQQIARLLNRAGKPTGRGNGWTEARVLLVPQPPRHRRLSRRRMGRAGRDHA